MRKVWVETLNIKAEEQGRQYCFLCPFNVNVGDIVLCDTSRGLMLGKVIPFVRRRDDVQAYIIGKVDMSAYLEMVDEHSKEKAAQNLYEQMRERSESFYNTQVFEAIAAIDPVMHGLLRRYNGLIGR